MIGIENKDSSFFTIESNDISLRDISLSKYLMSLSITEQMDAMATGSLQFRDPNHFLSRVLRTGAEIVLSWGYKDIKETPYSLIAKDLNTDEISGTLIRRGLKAFVSSPSGSGGNDGAITYNCNFTSFGFRGEDTAKKFETGSKRDVINTVFDDIGISSSKRLINFTYGSDTLNSDSIIRQEETSFKFLTRLAREWRCLFFVTYDSKGEPVGIFVDSNKVSSSQLPLWATNAIGGSHIIGYKGKLNNVKSYTWSSSEGENGVGDNVRIDIVDGQMIFRQFIAEEEKVITYRLNQERIKQVFEETDDIGTQTALMTELLSKNDFEQIKHFFDPVESSYAPQGFGYSINCDMIGNPLYIPSSQIKISNGFPDRLGGDQAIWYLNKVSHLINRSGYGMKIEIVDVFTLSPIGEPIF